MNLQKEGRGWETSPKGKQRQHPSARQHPSIHSLRAMGAALSVWPFFTMIVVTVTQEELWGRPNVTSTQDWLDNAALF